MHVKHPLIKPDILTLRKYQETIFSRAADANTLVVLPTGLGKTVIAAMVAAHRLYSFPGSKILFMAPTRPLTVQHHQTFEKFLNTEGMVTLTGRDPVEKRKEYWNENTAIFATPQTIENDIMRGLDLSGVSLMIFDECHRAVGDYSYTYIAREYMKKAKNPLILGLTASPSSIKETVQEITGNLHIERVEARTEEDPDVKPYIHKTKLEWVTVDLPPEFENIKKQIEALLRDDLRALKDMEYINTADISKVNKRTLLEMQAKIRKDISSGGECYVAASIAASALKINHALELLETQGLSSLDSYIERLSQQKSKAIKRLFHDERMITLTKNVHDLKVLGLDHPKLDVLAATVAEYPDKKVIVFTQYRDSVERIIEKLNERDILAHEFIGQAKKGAKKGMTQKEQIRIIERFREGEYNALVATSVAEEGLDIPAVDLVIFYEPIPSEIRSIQRRGRTGRSGAGKVIVLMAKKTRDEAYYWAARSKENKMKNVVKGMGKDFKSFIESNGDPNQKSLSSYTNWDEGTSGLTIFVDYREKCNTILRTLKEKANLRIQPLEVADYLISDRVAVERKTVDDFLASLMDKRLFTQMKDISSNFEKPFLMIEGSKDIYAQRDINANAIRGAIASISLDFGVYVVRTMDEEDSAGFLYFLAKREQEENRREVSLRGEKKPMLLKEKQQFIIESLPNVSAVLASRLLEKFGSVEGVINASKKELMEVDGIGEAKAEDIAKTIKSRYTP